GIGGDGAVFVQHVDAVGAVEAHGAAGNVLDRAELVGTAVEAEAAGRRKHGGERDHAGAGGAHRRVTRQPEVPGELLHADVVTDDAADVAVIALIDRVGLAAGPRQ